MWRVLRALFFLLIASGIIAAQSTSAQVMSPRYYDMGSPAFTDVWVDPVNGNDSNNGLSRAHAFQTINAAWGVIPKSTPLTQAYRLLLCRGEYPESSLASANWFELRQGTFAHPVVFKGVDGRHTARIHGYPQFDHCSYLYLIDLDFVTDSGYGGGSNVLHYSSDNHILLRGCTLNGWDGLIKQPQETLKVNQCQYVYVEDCDISNAFWMGLDYVAVQYGHVVGNKIHDTDNDCLMVKGGSAYLRIEGNEVYRVGQCGLVAGQGTTFGFMVTPWLHYEVYDTKFINNVVHDIQNAGIAARGDYNVLFANNTFYRVGLDHNSGSGMILCSPGGRLCQGDIDICDQYHTLGGWGQTAIGDESQCIPNRNVYIYDNIFYNPDIHTLYGHFSIFGPATAPAGTNIPNPVLSDDDLRIRGNIFWDGPSTWSDGLDDGASGCQPGNPTCTETQLHADNAINTVQPQLVDPAHGNFRPMPGGNVYRVATFPVPAFAGTDRQPHPLAPLGNLDNTNPRDYTGTLRPSLTLAGGYVPVPSDVDGDGKPDVALFNPSKHTTGFWYLHGATFSGGVSVSRIVPDAYRVAAVADFNGDGYPDLAVVNTSTRVIGLWYLKNGAVTGGAYVSVTPVAGWVLVAAADVDGDGHPDLVLENAGTRAVQIWHMNNADVVTQSTLTSTLPAGWDVAGIAPFNGDVHPDLLLFNASKRMLGFWYLDGTTVTSGGTLSSALPVGWTPAGAHDFDVDGIGDILLQNMSTHAAALWEIAGQAVKHSQALSSGPPTGWQFVSGQ